MQSYLIKNAQIVNENKVFKGDVLIEGEFIKEIGENIIPTDDVLMVDAEGKFLRQQLLEELRRL